MVFVLILINGAIPARAVSCAPDWGGPGVGKDRQVSSGSEERQLQGSKAPAPALPRSSRVPAATRVTGLVSSMSLMTPTR